MLSTTPRVNVLGVGVDPIDMDDAVGTIDSWIRTGQARYVCVTPAHSIMDCRRDPALRRIFNGSGLTTPDGMAIVWLLKLHGHRNTARVYGPDLVHAVCSASVAQGWRHFFFGGRPGVAETMAERLSQRYPGLAVAGTMAPPFHPLSAAEDESIVARINEAGPDIVWVGLGSPKQERWMAEHLDRLHASALIGVGAAFDFVSGTARQAPRWIQRSGLEWLYRWIHEPLRLAPRYRRYPLFALLVALQAAGLARFPMDDDKNR